MPQFRYRVVSPEGTPLEDTIEAATAHQATLRLQERGYTVNSVEPVQAEFRAGRGAQLSWVELELLVRQLQSITERNLPLVPALRAFTAEMKGSALKGVVDQVRIDLERGATIEEAIRNRGNALPPLFAAAVKAGESSGAGLPGVLKILTEHSARMITLQNTLHTALAYPLVVAGMAVGIAMLLLWKVMPVYADMARNNGVGFQQGRVVATMANAVADNPATSSVFLVAVAAIALWGTRKLTQAHANTLRADRIKLRVPRFGRVYYQITLARFSRTLAALLGARVPVVEALELAAAASGSPMLQQAVGDAAPRVALGNRISDALRASGYFGPGYCWLLGTAEARNAAEEALVNLAESSEREAAASDQMNLQLIGPLALIVAGSLILLITMQFVMPMYKMFGMFGM